MTTSMYCLYVEVDYIYIDVNALYNINVKNRFGLKFSILVYNMLIKVCV